MGTYRRQAVPDVAQSARMTGFWYVLERLSRHPHIYPSSGLEKDQEPVHVVVAQNAVRKTLIPARGRKLVSSPSSAFSQVASERP
jgi:hypothetical protein